MKKIAGILFIVFSFVLGIYSDIYDEHPNIKVIVATSFANFLFGIYLLIKSQNETTS